MAQTKVLHIINNLNRGGAETLLLRICEGVHSKNDQISFCVLVLEEKWDLLDEFQKAGISVEYVPVFDYPNWKRPFILAKKIKEYSPDVVHTHLMQSDRLGQPAAWLAGVKKRVCTIHNMEPANTRDRHDALSRKLTSLFASKLIAVSESAKQFCIDEKLYTRSKIDVIYNAPGFRPQKQISRSSFLHNPLRIVNVGRLHPQKNQESLIESLHKLCSLGMPCVLRILGEGELRGSLEKKVAELGLEDAVEFVGVTRNVEEHLNWADIFVAPSHYEGMPLAQIEAMSCGVPLIASNIPPHREILGADYIGLYEEGEIVDAIKRFFGVDVFDISSYLIERSSEYSLKNMISRYRKLYNEIY